MFKAVVKGQEQLNVGGWNSARILADEGLNRILERLAVDFEQSSIASILLAVIHSLVSTALHPVIIAGIINVIILTRERAATSSPANGQCLKLTW
ncbi:MAG: hypothetical protein EBS84_16975 [Proteobacteria bacterium]|nr:hypothetical protein [Verrucomicrobiota bacterium]NBU10687.1 hypothetical protein [Pseudomonadota bacterium]